MKQLTELFSNLGRKGIATAVKWGLEASDPALLNPINN